MSVNPAKDLYLFRPCCPNLERNMSVTAEYNTRVDQGTLLIGDRTFALDTVGLVSIHKWTNFHFARNIAMIGLLIVLLTTSIAAFVGHSADVLSFAGALIWFATLSVAGFSMYYGGWPRRYSVYLRTKSSPLTVNSSPLSYEQAEAIGKCISDAIWSFKHPDSERDDSQATKPFSGETKNTSEQRTPFYEPILAGNTVFVGADKIVTGGQILGLSGIQQVECYMDNLFKAYRYVLYSLGIFAGIGVVFILSAFIADTTKTNSSPIWALVIIIAFFVGSEFFFGLFVYGAVSFPVVWVVSVKRGKEELIVYKSENRLQAIILP
jgi:hypothetical protein